MNEPKRFDPQFSINTKQVTAIIIITAIIVFVALLIGYISNPDRSTPREMYENTMASIRPDLDPQGDQLMVTIPIINHELDLSVFRQNPQLAIFGGGAFLVIALVILVSLLRNVLR